jgi:hypothetical protein
MRRIMVGPNLVFESSRSSLAEPDTVGPANPGPSAPGQSNALGTPVAIGDSSRLLRYLVERGSQVVTPAISRTWCGNLEHCQPASWVERTIMLARNTPASATGEPNNSREHPVLLPTAMLAVRHLGSSNFERMVVVESVGEHRYEVHLAESESDPSICAQMRLVVPYVAFSGELISAATGQVIARIDDARAIATEAALERQVQVTNWRPVEARIPFQGGVHVYVASWTEEATLCAQIAAQYAGLRREIRDAADTASTVQEIIRNALDPLYRSETVDPSPRRGQPIAEEQVPTPSPAVVPSATTPAVAPTAVAPLTPTVSVRRRRR